MNFDNKMQTAINKQINAELFSAYLYLSMAAYFETQNLHGMASWMKKQSNEEMGHAMKFFAYVNDRGGQVVLDTIAKPESSWKNAHHVFETAYKHEQLVSSLIYGLTELAEQLKDHATTAMLKWFIDEQVEEENTARTTTEQLALIGDSKGALFQLDHILGKRE